MKISALVNEQFHLLTLGDVKVHARALNMTQALDWSERANAARNEVKTARDYSGMLRAVSGCVDVLADYPELTSGRAGEIPPSTWEVISTEQVIAAVDALLEVNDPFVQVRRERAEQEREGMQRLMALPEAERSRILQPLLSGLASDSESTPGASHSDGPGDSSSQPATL